MLQKMGWKEGHGLGSLGKGIREPVSVYGAPGDSGCFLLGLGTVYSWSFGCTDVANSFL